MGYIQGEGRGQGSLFPVAPDDHVSVDHICRVIDAFVARLATVIRAWLRARSGCRDRATWLMIHVICSSFICTVI